MAKVRGTPRTHISKENLDKLKEISDANNIQIFDALQFVLCLGFQELEIRGSNPKQFSNVERQKTSGRVAV